MKRVVSIVLTIAMLMSMFNITAFATEQTDANVLTQLSWLRPIYFSEATGMQAPDAENFTKHNGEMFVSDGTAVYSGNYYAEDRAAYGFESSTIQYMGTTSDSDSKTLLRAYDEGAITGTSFTENDRVHLSTYVNLVSGTVKSVNVMMAAAGVNITPDVSSSYLNNHKGQWVRLDILYQPQVTYTYTRINNSDNADYVSGLVYSTTNMTPGSSISNVEDGSVLSGMEGYDSDTYTYAIDKVEYGAVTAYINGVKMVDEQILEANDKNLSPFRYSYNNVPCRIAFHVDSALMSQEKISLYTAQSKVCKIENFDAESFELPQYGALSTIEGKYNVVDNVVNLLAESTVSDIVAPEGYTVQVYKADDTLCTTPVETAIASDDLILVKDETGKNITYYVAYTDYEIVAREDIVYADYSAFTSSATVSNGTISSVAGTDGGNDTAFAVYSTVPTQNNVFFSFPSMYTEANFGKRNYAVFEADVKFIDENASFQFATNQHNSVSSRVSINSSFINAGDWNKIAVKVDNDTLESTLYINGNEIGSTTASFNSSKTDIRFVVYATGVEGNTEAAAYLDNIKIYATDNDYNAENGGNDDNEDDSGDSGDNNDGVIYDITSASQLESSASVLMGGLFTDTDEVIAGKTDSSIKVERDSTAVEMGYQTYFQLGYKQMSIDTAKNLVLQFDYLSDSKNSWLVLGGNQASSLLSVDQAPYNVALDNLTEFNRWNRITVVFKNGSDETNPTPGNTVYDTRPAALAASPHKCDVYVNGVLAIEDISTVFGMKWGSRIENFVRIIPFNNNMSNTGTVYMDNIKLYETDAVDDSKFLSVPQLDISLEGMTLDGDTVVLTDKVKISDVLATDGTTVYYNSDMTTVLTTGYLSAGNVIAYTDGSGVSYYYVPEEEPVTCSYDIDTVDELLENASVYGGTATAMDDGIAGRKDGSIRVTRSQEAIDAKTQTYFDLEYGLMTLDTPDNVVVEFDCYPESSDSYVAITGNVSNPLTYKAVGSYLKANRWNRVVMVVSNGSTTSNPKPASTIYNTRDEALAASPHTVDLYINGVLVEDDKPTVFGMSWDVAAQRKESFIRMTTFVSSAKETGNVYYDNIKLYDTDTLDTTQFETIAQIDADAAGLSIYGNSIDISEDMTVSDILAIEGTTVYEDDTLAVELTEGNLVSGNIVAYTDGSSVSYYVAEPVGDVSVVDVSDYDDSISVIGGYAQAAAGGYGIDTAFELYYTDNSVYSVYMNFPGIYTEENFGGRPYGVFEADVKFGENGTSFGFVTNQHALVSARVQKNSELIRQNAWNHIVAVVDYETKETKLYVNGTLYAENIAAFNFARKDLRLIVNSPSTSSTIPAIYIDNIKAYATANPTIEDITTTVYRAVKANDSDDVIAIAYDADQGGQDYNGIGVWCDFTFDTIPDVDAEAKAIAGTFPINMLKVSEGTIVAKTADDVIAELADKGLTVSLNPGFLELLVGETSTINADAQSDGYKTDYIIWSTSSEAVAKVDNNGVVTAVSEGTAQISATAANGVSAVCNVTVTVPVIEEEEVQEPQVYYNITTADELSGTARNVINMIPSDDADIGGHIGNAIRIDRPEIYTGSRESFFELVYGMPSVKTPKYVVLEFDYYTPDTDLNFRISGSQSYPYVYSINRYFEANRWNKVAMVITNGSTEENPYPGEVLYESPVAAKEATPHTYELYVNGVLVEEGTSTFGMTRALGYGSSYGRKDDFFRISAISNYNAEDATVYFDNIKLYDVNELDKTQFTTILEWRPEIEGLTLEGNIIVLEGDVLVRTLTAMEGVTVYKNSTLAKTVTRGKLSAGNVVAYTDGKQVVYYTVPGEAEDDEITEGNVPVASFSESSTDGFDELCGDNILPVFDRWAFGGKSNSDVAAVVTLKNNETNNTYESALAADFDAEADWQRRYLVMDAEIYADSEAITTLTDMRWISSEGISVSTADTDGILKHLVAGIWNDVKVVVDMEDTSSAIAYTYINGALVEVNEGASVSDLLFKTSADSETKYYIDNVSVYQTDVVNMNDTILALGSGKLTINEWEMIDSGDYGYISEEPVSGTGGKVASDIYYNAGVGVYNEFRFDVSPENNLKWKNGYAPDNYRYVVMTSQIKPETAIKGFEYARNGNISFVHGNSYGWGNLNTAVSDKLEIGRWNTVTTIYDNYQYNSQRKYHTVTYVNGQKVGEAYINNAIESDSTHLRIAVFGDEGCKFGLDNIHFYQTNNPPDAAALALGTLAQSDKYEFAVNGIMLNEAVNVDTFAAENAGDYVRVYNSSFEQKTSGEVNRGDVVVVENEAGYRYYNVIGEGDVDVAEFDESTGSSDLDELNGNGMPDFVDGVGGKPSSDKVARVELSYDKDSQCYVSALGTAFDAADKQARYLVLDADIYVSEADIAYVNDFRWITNGGYTISFAANSLVDYIIPGKWNNYKVVLDMTNAAFSKNVSAEGSFVTTAYNYVNGALVETNKNAYVPQYANTLSDSNIWLNVVAGDEMSYYLDNLHIYQTDCPEMTDTLYAGGVTSGQVQSWSTADMSFDYGTFSSFDEAGSHGKLESDTYAIATIGSENNEFRYLLTGASSASSSANEKWANGPDYDRYNYLVITLQVKPHQMLRGFEFGSNSNASLMTGTNFTDERLNVAVSRNLVTNRWNTVTLVYDYNNGSTAQNHTSAVYVNGKKVASTNTSYPLVDSAGDIKRLQIHMWGDAGARVDMDNIHFYQTTVCPDENQLALGDLAENDKFVIDGNAIIAEDGLSVSDIAAADPTHYARVYNKQFVQKTSGQLNGGDIIVIENANGLKYYTVGHTGSVANGDYSEADNDGTTGNVMTEGEWQYKAYTFGGIDGVAVTGYTGSRADVYIPAALGGKPVLKIGNSAFAGNTIINSVTLSENIRVIGADAFKDATNLVCLIANDALEQIGSDAFSGCTAFNSAILGENISGIGKYAFGGCSSLIIYSVEDKLGHSYAVDNEIAYILIGSQVTQGTFKENGITYQVKNGEATAIAADSAITEAVISSTVLGYPVTMLDGTFNNNTNLVSVSLPNTLRTIGGNTFEGCTKLASIVIPESVTYIGTYAFKGCTDLTGIELPDAVKELGDYVFHNCTSLSEVKLSAGLIKIQDYAFNGCTSLQSIVIPDNITMIGIGAFAGCTKLASVDFSSNLLGIRDSAFKDCTSLTNVIIPDGVTVIGGSAFMNCDSITSVTLPSALTDLRMHAFDDCDGLTSITIPDGVKYLGTSVVANCDNLKTAYVGNGSSSVPENTFYKCSRLTSVTLAEGITSVGNNAFYGCTVLGSIDLPDSTVTIGDNAFNGCKALQSIVVGDKVTSIGKSVFQNCTSLSDITLGSGITSTGMGVFTNCTSLQHIELPTSLKTLRGNLFEGCVNLLDVVLSAETTGISGNLFKGCNNLRSIRVPAKVEGMSVDSFPVSTILFVTEGSYSHKFAVDNGLLYVVVSKESSTAEYIEDSGITYLISDGAAVAIDCMPTVTSVVIPDEVQGYPVNGIVNAFNGCTALKSVSLPFGLKYIGNSAFEGCTSLETIVIPEQVHMLGHRAFFGCTALDDVKLPQSVMTIGNYAFSGCSALTTISIPEGVETIGEGAFSKCSSLGEVTIPSTVHTINTALFSESGLTKINLPNTITAINSMAFNHCGNLTGVTLPESLLTIGSSAFDSCESIKQINLPSKLTVIDNSAFNECNGLREEVIPDSVETIGERSFYTKSITKATIGKNVKTIGPNAFLKRLDYVILPEGVESFDTYVGKPDGSGATCSFEKFTPLFVYKDSAAHKLAEANNLMYKTIEHGVMSEPFVSDNIKYMVVDGEAVAYGTTTQATSYTIPQSVNGYPVTTLLATFNGNKVVESVTLPEGLKVIGNRAFNTCTSLHSIVIPDSVTETGFNSFNGCTSLASVQLGSGIKKLGNNTFYGCSALEEIALPDGLMYFGDYVFNECYNLQSIIIPDSVISMGLEGFENCASLKSVTLSKGMSVVTDRCFNGCKSLENVVIPENVKLIEQYAFANCTSLKNITLNEGLEYIGLGAFMNCRSLENITIPASVTNMFANSFPADKVLTVHKNSYAHALADSNELLYFVIQTSDNPQIAYGSAISGTVYADDAPAVGATVEIIYDDGTVKETVKTNSAGEYLFTYAEVGDYTVRVTDVRGNVGIEPVGVKRMNVFEVYVAGNTDINLKTSSTITGKVPAGSVTVTITDEDGQVIKTVTTNNGSFTLDGIANGTYIIKVETDNGSTTKEITVFNGQITTDGKLVDSDNELKFEVEQQSASISGYVYDKDDVAKVWADITVYNDDGIAVANTKTDENGYYTIKGLVNGEYSIVAEYNELRKHWEREYEHSVTLRGYAYVEVTEIANYTADNIVVYDVQDNEEKAKSSISGKVTAQGENQISEVILADVFRNEVARYETKANGKYKFTNVRHGLYFIMAVTESNGFGMTVVLVRENESLENCDITVLKGSHITEREEAFINGTLDPDSVSDEELEEYRQKVMDEKQYYDGLSKKEKKKYSKSYIERLNKWCERFARPQYVKPEGVEVEQSDSIVSKDDMERGEPVVIEISIEEKEEHKIDNKKGIKDKDDFEKKSIEDNAKSGGRKVEKYYDITMTKDGKQINNIHKDTDSTGKMRITMPIPEDMRDENRTFTIVHVHNGEAVTLVDLDNDPNTITFEVDKFSTFALCSSDEALTEDVSEEEEILYGDVNGDGKITTVDAALIRRYVAKMENITIDLVAADVNLDGKVTTVDAACVRRHLAKIDGYETLPYIK